ncbi:MAG: SDR family oxidoreductase [Rhodospirillales bacterium]|nr:SDR family oxidoreductase [Rhodospirillales bacterium]
MPSVLITGANRGIGLELSRQFAADGWRVIACCRDPSRASALDGIASGIHALDVADPRAIAALGETLAGETIDVLLNNAGVYGERQSFGTIDSAEWRHVFQVNAIAPVLMAEAFLQQVARSQRRIIASITSRMGSIGDNSGGGSIVYRSSKAALNAAMKSLAIDLAPKGITCVVLHPGWVRTEMGGGNAPMAPTDSARGLRGVIGRLTSADSGRFLNYDGEELPW